MSFLMSVSVSEEEALNLGPCETRNTVSLSSESSSTHRSTGNGLGERDGPLLRLLLSLDASPFWTLSGPVDDEWAAAAAATAAAAGGVPGGGFLLARASAVVRGPLLEFLPWEGMILTSPPC